MSQNQPPPDGGDQPRDTGFGQAPEYGQAPGYGPAPQYGEAPQYGQAPPPPQYGPSVPPVRPASMTRAVMLMRVGAGLSLLGLVISFVSVGSMRDQIQKQLQAQGSQITSSQLDTAVAVGIGAAVISGLLAVALWLWMALVNGRGRKWARVVATVFFGISILSIAANLAQRQTPLPSLALALVNVVLGGYIIYLLYRPESTAFYDQVTASRTR